MNDRAVSRGLYLAPFDELSDPAVLVELAVDAEVWPHRRPVRRAVRWDGLFPIELPDPTALAELAREIEGDRDGGLSGFDLVVEVSAGDDPKPWHEAGATWVLTAFGMQPRVAEVREAIERGPR